MENNNEPTNDFREGIKDTSATNSFFESLPENLRGEPSLKNVKSAEDLASQFVNAQKLIGKKVSEPTEGTDEDYTKFYNQIGRPEDLTGYEFDLSDEHKELGYDIEDFKKLAHESGLTKRQAEKFFQNHVNKLSLEIEESSKALVLRNEEFQKLGVETFGSEEAFSRASAVAQEYIVNNVPEAIRAEMANLDNKTLLSVIHPIAKLIESQKIEDQPMSQKAVGSETGLLNPIDIKAKMNDLYADPNFRKDPRLQAEYEKLVSKLMKAESK